MLPLLGGVDELDAGTIVILGLLTPYVSLPLDYFAYLFSNFSVLFSAPFSLVISHE